MSTSCRSILLSSAEVMSGWNSLKCIAASGAKSQLSRWGARLIGREDEDVSEAVRDILETEGIRVLLNAKCISLAKHDGRIAVGVKCDEGPPDVLSRHVLLAVGRTPNTNDLGL